MELNRLFLVVVAILVAIAQEAFASFPSWAQEFSDAGKDSYVDVQLNPANFQFAWNTPLDPGWYYDRGVATDGTRVFRTTRNHLPTSIEGYRVVALDIKSGNLAWERPLPGYFHPYEVGEPGVMNGVVYVNREGHSGLSGGTLFDRPRLFGLDATTGAVLSETFYTGQWSSKDPATLADGHVVAAGGYYGGLYSFAPQGGIQWFNSQGGDSEVSAIANGRVYRPGGRVLDLSTGLGLPNIVHPDGLAIFGDPMISEDGLLFYGAYNPANSNDIRMSAFKLADHQYVRDFALATYPDSIAVGNGRLAVKHADGISFYDVASGVNYKNLAVPTVNTNEIILTKTHLFVHIGNALVGDEIHAINVVTGESEWHFPAVYNDSIALGDGYLFVSDEFGITAISLTVPEPTTILLAVFALPVVGTCRRTGRMAMSVRRTACSGCAPASNWSR
jgi:outer membrane protein assembly factor BamB